MNEATPPTPAIPTPPPSSDLDHQLSEVIRSYRIAQRIAQWFLVLAFVVAVISLIVSLASFSTEAHTAQRAVTNVVSAQCSFYADLATLPPPPKTTALGVKILVDSRNAYVGLGCRPKLAPPSKALVQDAAQFGLQLKG